MIFQDQFGKTCCWSKIIHVHVFELPKMFSNDEVKGKKVHQRCMLLHAPSSLWWEHLLWYLDRHSTDEHTVFRHNKWPTFATNQNYILCLWPWVVASLKLRPPLEATHGTINILCLDCQTWLTPRLLFIMSPIHPGMGTNFFLASYRNFQTSYNHSKPHISVHNHPKTPIDLSTGTYKYPLCKHTSL